MESYNCEDNKDLNELTDILSTQQVQLQKFTSFVDGIAKRVDDDDQLHAATKAPGATTTTTTTTAETTSDSQTTMSTIDTINNPS